MGRLFRPDSNVLRAFVDSPQLRSKKSQNRSSLPRLRIHYAFFERETRQFPTIYSTTLSDAEHLQLVCERPGNVGELDRLHVITSVTISKNKTATEVWTTVEFDKSGKQASTLTMRHVITAPNAQKSLSNLALVATKPVSDSVLEVSFDGYKHVFLSILFLFVVVNPKQGMLVNLFTLRYLTLFFPAKFILT